MFDEIKSLVEKVNYNFYLEVVEDEWTFHNDDNSGVVYWVVEGEVYASEIKREGTGEQEDCIYVNTDDGCGDTVTLVLHKDKKVSWDDFYDKHEEYV